MEKDSTQKKSGGRAIGSSEIARNAKIAKESKNEKWCTGSWEVKLRNQILRHCPQDLSAGFRFAHAR
jgi:hypothetical protein